MEEMSDDDDIRKVIMGLKWSIKYCTSATHILKTNDDVWVNIPRFLAYFESNGADRVSEITTSIVWVRQSHLEKIELATKIYN